MIVLMKCLLALCLIFSMLLPAAAGGEAGSEMDLLAINVGKADCLLLLYADKTYMVDTGSAESWGAVSAALKANGITSLDGVILTHTDKDHASGMMALATSSVAVGAWYASAYFCEVKEKNHPAVLAAAVRGMEVVWLKSGDSLPFADGSLSVLGPMQSFDDKENNNSLVLYAEAAGCTMLLAGDMEEPAEQLLLGAGLAPRADVLKVGHHAEGDATSEAFARAVQPKLAVISTNSVAEPDTPSRRVLKLLKALGAQVALTENASGGVMVTCRDGRVSCDLVGWPEPPAAADGIVLFAKDNAADTVTLRNTGSEAVDLSGWYVVSGRGMDIYVFPEGTGLAAGASLTLGTRTTKEDTDLLWPDKNVWHDSKDDPAGLYDVYGRLISHID